MIGTAVRPSISFFRNAHASEAKVPEQEEPAPAVQPKQWRPCHDSPFVQESGIEGLDPFWGSVVHRPADGEVEIAVVEGPVPVDADLMAAHQMRQGQRIEGPPEGLQVVLQFALRFKAPPEPAERHIRQNDQAGEGEAETAAKLFPVDPLQIRL